jgi:hypothetical protein
MVNARPVLVVDLGVKVTLVGLLILALTRPDLPQFDGDAYAVWRASLYPAALLVVPLGWVLFARPRAVPFPYAVDVLIPLPLLLDVAAPRLYHSVEWWDQVMHVASWGALAAISVLVLTRLGFGTFATVVLALLSGLLVAGLWESFEYVFWVRPSPELLTTALADTQSDLTCDLAASIAAIAMTSVLLARRGRTRVERPASRDRREASPLRLARS